MAGRPLSTFNLEERMAFYRVPAVSLAVVEGGELEWARAYGLADVVAGIPATTETLFQAASISKAVSALAVLQLVDDGLMTLDEDINAKLTSWRVPDDPRYAGDVTLRGLLTHTSGLSVGGFEGYRQGEPIPTTLQVLDGQEPSNSPPVRRILPPGTEFSYSGGGFVLMQLLVEDLRGAPFSEVMRRRVLEPSGMRSSTYEQPPPRALEGTAAVGHRDDGRPVEGGWHTFPELGPGGLWTTASDIAHYILTVHHAYLGNGNSVLSKELARQMLEPGDFDWGLGLGVDREGNRIGFSHGGANPGFMGLFVGYAALGEGAAVLTNSDNGMSLALEVLRAVAAEYDWPGYEQETVTEIVLSDDAAQEYVGHYTVPAFDDLEVEVRVLDGRLALVIDGGPATELVPVGTDRFVRMSKPLQGGEFVFERDPDDAILGFVNEAGLRGVRAW